jgi:hypothetical protein
MDWISTKLTTQKPVRNSSKSEKSIKIIYSKLIYDVKEQNKDAPVL